MAVLNSKEMAEVILNGSHEELTELVIRLVAGIAELRQWAAKVQADDQESPESSGRTAEETTDAFFWYSVGRRFMAEAHTRPRSRSRQSKRQNVRSQQ